MKLLFIFILLISEMAAKKHKINYTEDSSRNGNEHLDMNGTLRKSFFVQGVLSNPDESSVYSPLSVLMPLGKLALGADGKSLEELLDAIGVTRKTLIGSHFKPLILELRYLPGVKLDIASKLYVSSYTRLKRSFQEQAREIFGSSAEKIDFEYPTYATEKINSWVASQTNDLITDMLRPTDLPPSTSAIIINAVYFSGKWKKRFEKVSSGKFYAPNGSKTIPMMSIVERFNFTTSEALGSQLVKIPFMGDKASFLLVLPTSKTGLPVLLNQLKLTPEILDLAIARMKETKIQLTMPKFKIESELNLVPVLRKIGVKQIFDKNDSGLSSIVRDEIVSVTSAKQKTFVEVNEYGAEAAASSMMGMTKLLHEKPRIIQADRPFLFFILAKRQQLFAGTFISPN